MEQTDHQRSEFIRGVTAAIPIVIGYIPISIAFGVISLQSGIPFIHTVMMSVIVFAGASQFMAVNMASTGAGWIEIVAAAFILNLRHLIMSMSLMNRLKRMAIIRKVGLSFGITDETFAIASLTQGDPESEPAFSFIMGLMITAYGTWVVGTALGGLLANVIPETISAGMSIALYAMFIGLLMPAVRSEWRVGIIAVFSMVLSGIFHLILSGGWPIVLATIFGAITGVVFHREE